MNKNYTLALIFTIPLLLHPGTQAKPGRPLILRPAVIAGIFTYFVTIVDAQRNINKHLQKTK